ncbi:MAG: hypothetical protein M3198_02870 [Actinomycetota bacterium]|nr:hypothetical protein [Actinomycetota bacterium]
MENGGECPGPNELFSMTPTGDDVTQLTDNDTFERAMVPSEEHHWLVYSTSDEFMGCGLDGQLVAMDFDGATTSS